MRFYVFTAKIMFSRYSKFK